MPGRLFLDHPPSAFSNALGGVDWPGEGPRPDVAPGEMLQVLTPEGLRPMRWAIIPVGRKNARGRPVMETLVNLRGETVFEKGAFDGFRRGVVAASGWYEWTGAKGRKTRWRITRRDGAPVLFAAMWDVWVAPGGRDLPQVATVTCPPSGDVREIHDRMGVVLDPCHVPTWLGGEVGQAKALIRPLEDGTLDVKQADPA